MDLHIGLRSIGQGQYVNKCKTLKIVLLKRKWSFRAKITMFVGLYNIEQKVRQQYYKDYEKNEMWLLGSFTINEVV